MTRRTVLGQSGHRPQGGRRAPVDFFWTSERSLSSAPSGRQNVAERGQPSVEDRKSGSASPGGATFRADFGTGRASGTRTHVKSTVNGVE